MRHASILLLMVLAAGAAQGQTPPEPTEVKQALHEALVIQAPVPATLPRLPEHVSEPRRTVAPRARPAPSQDTPLSGEVLERAGRMAPQVPAAPGEKSARTGEAARASGQSKAAAGQVRADTVRRQQPPRKGTPGAPPPGGKPSSPRLLSAPSASPAGH